MEPTSSPDAGGRDPMQQPRAMIEKIVKTLEQCNAKIEASPLVQGPADEKVTRLRIHNYITLLKDLRAVVEQGSRYCLAFEQQSSELNQSQKEDTFTHVKLNTLNDIVAKLAELEKVQPELRELREDVKTLREDFRASHEHLREDFRASHEHLREDFRASHEKLANKMDSIIHNMNHHILDTTFDSFREPQEDPEQDLLSASPSSMSVSRGDIYDATGNIIGTVPNPEITQLMQRSNMALPDNLRMFPVTQKRPPSSVSSSAQPALKRFQLPPRHAIEPLDKVKNTLNDLEEACSEKASGRYDTMQTMKAVMLALDLNHFQNIYDAASSTRTMLLTADPIVRGIQDWKDFSLSDTFPQATLEEARSELRSHILARQLDLRDLIRKIKPEVERRKARTASPLLSIEAPDDSYVGLGSDAGGDAPNCGSSGSMPAGTTDPTMPPPPIPQSRLNQSGSTTSLIRTNKSAFQPLEIQTRIHDSSMLSQLQSNIALHIRSHVPGAGPSTSVPRSITAGAGQSQADNATTTRALATVQTGRLSTKRNPVKAQSRVRNVTFPRHSERILAMPRTQAEQNPRSHNLVDDPQYKIWAQGLSNDQIFQMICLPPIWKSEKVEKFKKQVFAAVGKGSARRIVQDLDNLAKGHKVEKDLVRNCVFTSIRRIEGSLQVSTDQRNDCPNHGSGEGGKSGMGGKTGKGAKVASSYESDKSDEYCLELWFAPGIQYPYGTKGQPFDTSRLTDSAGYRWYLAERYPHRDADMHFEGADAEKSMQDFLATKDAAPSPP